MRRALLLGPPGLRQLRSGPGTVGPKATATERLTAAEYLEVHGAAELWLVDTASRSVMVRRRERPGRPFATAIEVQQVDTLVSPLLPEFAVVAGELVPAP